MVTIKRYEAVEINVPNGSTLTRYSFPDLPNLRNAQITNIEVYTAGSLSASPLTGSTLMTTQDLKKSFLTLYQGDLQLVYSLPVIRLNEISNGTDPFVYELPIVANMIVSWVKSYVSLPTAPATTNAVYAFGIYYNFGEIDKSMADASGS